ncbi:MAG: hypothetical protein A2W20_01100 [Candidatus Aminicenantes bacterium RBG_16_66_30]|nr:MAG: hypothetical protein A2W20_01100 [Candidatus Aminicenantes bacterium RBG_16_66_30]
MTSAASSGLGHFIPEAVLLAAAVASMFVHLFAKRGGRRAAGYVALAGIAAAAVALALTPPSAETFFAGHLAADGFALFFKAVILAAGALAIVLAFRFGIFPKPFLAVLDKPVEKIIRVVNPAHFEVPR